MLYELYIIKSKDEDDLTVFEIWEKASWKKEKLGEACIDTQKGGSPVGLVYKQEYAEEFVNTHNQKLITQ